MARVFDLSGIIAREAHGVQPPGTGRPALYMAGGEVV